MADTVVVVRGGTTTVRPGAGAAKRVTLDARTVAEIANNRPKTVVQPGTSPLQVQDKHTTVKTGAGMGVQGPPGLAGGTIPAIDFSYGDVSSRSVYTSPGGTLVNARLVFDTPFDGLGAAVSVGTATVADAHLPAALNDPSTTSEFETTPDAVMAPGEKVYLYITPGSGATQGAGRLFLEHINP